MSQILALHVARPMLDELHRLALDNHVRFTCYVDDLTWSGARATASLLWEAKKIVWRHGFAYHGGKAYGPTHSKVITGVEVRKTKTHVPAVKVRMFHALVEACIGMPEAQRAAEALRLMSTAAALSQIDPRFATYRERLKKIRHSALQVEKKISQPADGSLP